MYELGSQEKFDMPESPFRQTIDRWIEEFDTLKQSNSEGINQFIKQIGDTWKEVNLPLPIDIMSMDPLRKPLFGLHFRMQHFTTQNQRNRYLPSLLSDVEKWMRQTGPIERRDWDELFQKCIELGYELPSRPALAKNPLLHQADGVLDIITHAQQLRYNLPTVEHLENYVTGADQSTIDFSKVLLEIQEIEKYLDEQDPKHFLSLILDKFDQATNKPNQLPMSDDKKRKVEFDLHKLSFRLLYGYKGSQQEASRPLRQLITQQIENENGYLKADEWNEIFTDWSNKNQLPTKRSLQRDPLIALAPDFIQIIENAERIKSPAPSHEHLKDVQQSQETSYQHPQESAFPLIQKLCGAVLADLQTKKPQNWGVQSLVMAGQGIKHFNTALDEMVKDFPNSTEGIQRLLVGLQTEIHGELRNRKSPSSSTHLPSDHSGTLRQGRDSLFYQLHGTYTRLNKWEHMLEKQGAPISQSCLQIIATLKGEFHQPGLLRNQEGTRYLPNPQLIQAIESETIQRGYPKSNILETDFEVVRVPTRGNSTHYNRSLD